MIANGNARAQASLQEVPAPITPCSDIPILSGFPDVGTVDDVAHALQLKPNAVRSLCRQGAIRALKCGNLWRIPRAWLIEFIEGGGSDGCRQAIGGSL